MFVCGRPRTHLERSSSVSTHPRRLKRAKRVGSSVRSGEREGMIAEWCSTGRCCTSQWRWTGAARIGSLPPCAAATPVSALLIDHADLIFLSAVLIAFLQRGLIRLNLETDSVRNVESALLFQDLSYLSTLASGRKTASLHLRFFSRLCRLTNFCACVHPGSYAGGVVGWSLSPRGAWNRSSGSPIWHPFLHPPP